MKNSKGHQIISQVFILVFIVISLNVTGQSTDYPPPACIFYDNLSPDTVTYGIQLPFSEDWISGEFETNGWTVEGSHWDIDTDQGNPSPAAVFNGQPGINNYSEVLNSYFFRGDLMSIEAIYIEYDLKLECDNNTGNEYLRLEVWDFNDQAWHYCSMFSNDNGSFEWIHQKKRIYSLALGKVFRIRFKVDGTNSGDIVRWSIDNIKLYRVCKAPEYLTVEKLPDNSRKLRWYELLWFSPEHPLRWDDGEYSGNSIGTGDAVEFDVATRWTPEQMAQYAGGLIAIVGFLPAEEYADYNIRVWEGDSASELIVDQPVIFPVIGEWNEIVLDNLIPLDITKELWVGYHVNAQTGYPAGVDDGPAKNGYGNMMNFGGWKTLLQINPDLDYNWNLYFYLISFYNSFSLSSINIYRQDNFNGEFNWLDSTNNFLQYIDDNTIEGASYCYKTNAVYINGFDYCISPFSNVDCDPVLPGLEENPAKEFSISIYPSPASEYVKITCEIPIKQVEIFNSLGENVFSERCYEKEKVIPVINLPAGLYFIMIKTDEGVETRKAVVFR